MQGNFLIVRYLRTRNFNQTVLQEIRSERLKLHEKSRKYKPDTRFLATENKSNLFDSLVTLDDANACSTDDITAADPNNCSEPRTQKQSKCDKNFVNRNIEVSTFYVRRNYRKVSLPKNPDVLYRSNIVF